MPGKGCKKTKGGKGRKHTPFTSKSQTGAGGVAYAAKKKKIPVSKLGPAAKKMYESMSKAELKRHLHEAKGKKLPQRVKKKR